MRRADVIKWASDQRVKLTKQAIQGARIIKMNAWELGTSRHLIESTRCSFSSSALAALNERIKGARAKEMNLLLEASYLRALHEVGQAPDRSRI